MHSTVRTTVGRWIVGVGIGAMSAAAVWAQAQSQAPQPLPARKPGLWEVTVRGAGEPAGRGQTVRQCTTQQAEPIMLLAVVPGQEHCHEVKVRKTARGHEVRTLCYVHDNRVDATVELTGDLDAAYRGVFEVKYSKPVRFNPGRTEFEGRWLGACQAGQRAGDMVLPNGATVNVVDDRKRAESHDHAGHKH